MQSLGMRIMGPRVLPLIQLLPIPLQVIPDQSMRQMWIVMGIWTCSRLQCMTIKSIGMRTMDPRVLLPILLPLLVLKLGRSMRWIWIEMEMWMFYRLLGMMTKSAGLKTMVPKVLLPIPLPQVTHKIQEYIMFILWIWMGMET